MTPEDIVGSVMEFVAESPEAADPSLLVGLGAALVAVYIAAVAVAKLTPTTKDDELLAKARPVYVFVVGLLSRRAKK